MDGINIMLDCSLDLSVLLNFLPLPLVYRYSYVEVSGPSLLHRPLGALAIISIVPLLCSLASSQLFIACCSPKILGLPKWKVKGKAMAEDDPLEEVIKQVQQFFQELLVHFLH